MWGRADYWLEQLTRFEKPGEPRVGIRAQYLYLRGRIADIVAERERLMAIIPAFGVVRRTWPSAANFFLVEVEDSDSVIAAAKDRGILLRDFGSSLPGCIRITVGEALENDRLLEVLTELDRNAS